MRRHGIKFYPFSDIWFTPGFKYVNINPTTRRVLNDVLEYFYSTLPEHSGFSLKQFRAEAKEHLKNPPQKATLESFLLELSLQHVLEFGSKDGVYLYCFKPESAWTIGKWDMKLLESAHGVAGQVKYRLYRNTRKEKWKANHEKLMVDLHAQWANEAEQDIERRYERTVRRPLAIENQKLPGKRLSLALKAHSRTLEQFALLIHEVQTTLAEPGEEIAHPDQIALMIQHIKKGHELIGQSMNETRELILARYDFEVGPRVFNSIFKNH